MHILVAELMMKKMMTGDGEATSLATNVIWGGLCNEVGEGDASYFTSHCRVVFHGSNKSEPDYIFPRRFDERLPHRRLQSTKWSRPVNLHYYARVHRI